MADFLNLPSKEGQDSQNQILSQIASSFGATNGALKSAIDLANASATNAVDKALDIEARFQILTTEQQQDAEVIDARQGALSLGANITEVKSQLAQTETDVLGTVKRLNTKLSGYWQEKPQVIFIDDDAVGTPLFNNIAPIFTQRNIPLNIAAINTLNSMASPTQTQTLLDFQNNHGWEILSHGWDDKTFDSLTQEQLEKNFTDSIADFKERGFNVESVVYPQGGMTPLSKAITGKYFRAGFATSAVPTNVADGLESMDTIDIYAIKRINIGDYPSDLDYYKSAINHAKANNQLIVFYTHSYQFGDGNANIALLESVVDYVLSQGIEITTPKKVLDVYEPAVQVGNTNSYAGNTRLLKNGKMFGNYNLELMGGNNFSVTDKITKYKNPITIFAVTAAQASTLGWGVPCTVVTIKGSFLYGYDYQLKLGYSSNKIEMRRVMTTIDDEWSSWTGLANDADVGATRLTDDFGTSATLIGQYPYNKISTFVSTSSASGFPSGGIGYVTTYHFAVATWSRQEFRPRRTNEIWSRFVGADGQWTIWTLLETRGNGYGNTAARPTSGVADGYMYTDYELGKTIVKVGSNWKDTMGVTIAPF